MHRGTADRQSLVAHTYCRLGAVCIPLNDLAHVPGLDLHVVQQYKIS